MVRDALPAAPPADVVSRIPKITDAVAAEKGSRPAERSAKRQRPRRSPSPAGARAPRRSPSPKPQETKLVTCGCCQVGIPKQHESIGDDLGPLGRLVSISGGANQSDGSGRGVVAVQGLPRGMKYRDPSVLYVAGGVPKDLRNSDGYIAMTDGVFRLRYACGVDSLTYCLNEARGDRSANIAWTTDHAGGLTFLAWTTRRDIRPGEELLVDYRAEDAPRDDTSQSARLDMIAAFLDEHYPDEAKQFRAASEKRATPDVFVGDTNLSVSACGFGGVAFGSRDKVAYKKPGLLSFGGAFDDLPSDGVEAMRALHGKGLTFVPVESEDGSGQGTCELATFAERGRGAVYRRSSPELLGKHVDEQLTASNWATRLHRKEHEPSFLMAHAPYLTRTHRDNLGVWAWVHQFCGVSLFVVWSLEDGDAAGLTDVDDDWAADAWATFFSLPSARLLLLRAGDFGLLRAGAYHRVFTLETKVCAYGDYFCANGFEATVAAVAREANEDDNLMPVDEVFLRGLASEAYKPELAKLVDVCGGARDLGQKQHRADVLARLANADLDLVAKANRELRNERSAAQPNLKRLAGLVKACVDGDAAPEPPAPALSNGGARAPAPAVVRGAPPPPPVVHDAVPPAADEDCGFSPESPARASLEDGGETTDAGAPAPPASDDEAPAPAPPPPPVIDMTADMSDDDVADAARRAPTPPPVVAREPARGAKRGAKRAAPPVARPHKAGKQMRGPNAAARAPPAVAAAPPPAAPPPIAAPVYDRAWLERRLRDLDELKTMGIIDDQELAATRKVALESFGGRL